MLKYAAISRDFSRLSFLGRQHASFRFSVGELAHELHAVGPGESASSILEIVLPVA